LHESLSSYVPLAQATLHLAIDGSAQSGQKVEQGFVKSIGVTHVRGMTASRDDDLAASSDRSHKHIRLLQRDDLIVLAPDGQDRSLDLREPLAVYRNRNRSNGHQTSYSLRLSRHQR